MTNFSLRAFSFLLAFGFIIGCASIPEENIVFHDKYNSIRIESIRGKGEPPPDFRFDHPVEFSEEEMAALLGSIQVVQPPGFMSRVLFNNRAVPEPAFNEKEIQRFAPIFKKAFAKAGPEDRVVFFLHHKRKIYKGTVSSGVAFVKDGNLNLILGRFLKGNEPGKPDIDIKGKPLPYTRDQDFYLYAGDHQNLITEKRFPVTREIIFPKRWLMINSTALLSAPADEVREISLEEASSDPPVRETMKPPSTPEESLENKLRTLKNVYEEGLITEEEYQQKRGELLRDF